MDVNACYSQGRQPYLPTHSVDTCSHPLPPTEEQRPLTGPSEAQTLGHRPPATPFTVTGGAASSIAFFTGNGAELTFTNITWELAGRFARIDGNTAIVFGNGTTINHSDTIFVYDNGNSYTAGGDTTDDKTDDVYVSNFHYSFDIQEGAVINATGAISKGLIYKDDSKNPATITMKIAGTIKMAAKKPVFHAG